MNDIGIFGSLSYEGDASISIKTIGGTLEISGAAKFFPNLDRPPCFKQGDAPWGSLKIGTGTMAQYGCLITSLASLAKWVGYDTDPGKTLEALRSAGALDGNFLGHPGKVHDVFPKLLWRYDDSYKSLLYNRWETSKIDWSSQPVDTGLLRALLDQQPIPIQVDYNPITDEIEPHFVLAIHYQPAAEGTLEDDLLVMDPVSGTYTSVLTYFNPTWLGTWMKTRNVTKVARTVVGARVWEVFG